MIVEPAFGDLLPLLLRRHWKLKIYWRHLRCLPTTLEELFDDDNDGGTDDALNMDDHCSQMRSRTHEHCHDWHIEASKGYWRPRRTMSLGGWIQQNVGGEVENEPVE